MSYTTAARGTTSPLLVDLSGSCTDRRSPGRDVPRFEAETWKYRSTLAADEFAAGGPLTRRRSRHGPLTSWPSNAATTDCDASMSWRSPAKTGTRTQRSDVLATSATVAPAATT